jgi:hypothetical protein
VPARAGASITGGGDDGQVLQVRAGSGQDDLTVRSQIVGRGQVADAAGQQVANPQRHAARRPVSARSLRAHGPCRSTTCRSPPASLIARQPSYSIPTCAGMHLTCASGSPTFFSYRTLGSTARETRQTQSRVRFYPEREIFRGMPNQVPLLRRARCSHAPCCRRGADQPVRPGCALAQPIYQSRPYRRISRAASVLPLPRVLSVCTGVCQASTEVSAAGHPGGRQLP